MLTNLFDKITRLSLRFRWAVLALALLMIALGALALPGLNLELLPQIEFPQTVVVIQWPGAESAEQFVDEVTQPLEQALAEVDGVVNVESTTGRSFAFVIVRNEFGLDQDDMVAEVEAAANAVPLPADAETPQILNFSLSDLPVVIASASSADLSLAELKQLVTDDLEPRLEGLDQISEVNVSGGQELPEDLTAAEGASAAEPVATATAEPTPTAEPSPTPEPTATATAEPAAASTSVSTPAGLEALEPLPLPDSWIAAGAQAGQTLATTADVTPEVMAGIVGFAPQLLADLEPAMWRRIDPAAVALVLPAAGDSLDPDLAAQLEAIGRAAAALPPEPVDLPPSWVAAAGAAGFALATTADISPDALALLAAGAPQLLDDLLPEHLLAFDPAVLAALPESYITGLDEDLQDTLAVVVARAAQAEAAAEGGAPTATRDPARLPDILIQGAQSFGVELESAADITPDFMRQVGALGPQGLQILQLLTPDNLRALQPEVIALLPPDFVATLDPALAAELDELAADFGGAGALALAEAESAAPADEGAPVLTGIWVEPGPAGEASPFQTAGDLLNNAFVPTAAELLNFLPSSPQVQDPAAYFAALTPEVIAYLAENEAGFIANLAPSVLELMSPETIAFILENYRGDLDPAVADRLAAVAAGEAIVFVPEASITRTDGDPSLVLNIYKDGDANTVVVAHRIFDELAAYESDNSEVSFSFVFEQASFIEDAIAGVSREGALGALFAVIVILIFLSGRVRGRHRLSWRATLVVGVSIPLSVFTALFLMRWLPPTVGAWLHDLADSSGSGLIGFVARLFPSSVTLNIMTLSGLTVAVGRVVDDSIVVLENIYRYIQKGGDRRQAVIEGTREVAIAIFTSTATTVAVFLPLGLLGGLIGSFFLPFGLTVTYALAASFVVAITVVPALAYMLIRAEDIPEASDTLMQRGYTPTLKAALNHRGLTMLVATLIFAASLYLLTQLPRSFIPSIGEPTINVTVQLPGDTPMAETDAQVREFESQLAGIEGIERYQTEIGSGGGLQAFFSGGGVSQNVANVTISTEEDDLVELTNAVRDQAVESFGADNVVVSAASQTGFSGFSLIVTGDSMADLQPAVADVKAALADIDLDEDGRPDIVNISSNLDDAANGNQSIIRIDQRPAVSFSGELETDNTLGVTGEAKARVAAVSTLPAGAEVTEGFESEQQTQGFRDTARAIAYSIVIVYAIMALSFRSLVHPFTILFSLPFALVGAALALYLTGSVLGISAMIGLMMLVGVVVTNAIVLMELVQQLRRRGLSAREALVQGGRTRLRPIWMTALAAALALVPLALSQESGALIASELAVVVIGGLLVSTALTLLVVPVVYSLFDPLNRRLGRERRPVVEPSD